MTNNLSVFLKEVSADKAWLEELNARQTKEEAVAFALDKAAALGIELTAEDFEPSPDEISEDELVAVAGGGPCSCCGGGGGTADPMECAQGQNGAADWVCACVVYGQGDGEHQRYDAATNTYLEPQKDTMRCMCPLFGSGNPTAICW